MPAPILTTKLFLPTPRLEMVPRPRLVERLREGLAAGRKLTLLSAPAGSGKTTLLSEWISLNTEVRRQNDESSKAISLRSARGGNLNFRVAWLSIDEADSDPARFLLYLVSALQTVAPSLGEGAWAALQTPQPPPIETLLTGLLNEITELPEKVILVLDDYHLLDSQTVDSALAFVLDHLPPQLHLVVTSRADPNLPLARLRARSQLTELRAADLRFSPHEAAEFLNRVMGLNLSEENIAALEARTEGWIAGLQLAALSIQGHTDPARFIQSFTGSQRFILDYLLEEVLHRQPESIQTFLLHTSILDRFCGPLCEAVTGSFSSSGQEILAYLERANLFIIPLDNEMRWYRYHHLFGDMLRQRLGQSLVADKIADFHIRASQWYEHQGLVYEAFHHAAAANDIERAERLIENPAIGLHFRSVAIATLDWLASLPKPAKDARPSLWLKSATLALVAGQTTGVEAKLQAAENILQKPEADAQTRDLHGQIACARATLALTRYDPATMIVQAQHALELLAPDNLTFRFTANWALTAAHLFRGERTEATRACLDGIAISQKSGDAFSIILATGNLGLLQELDNQLLPAAEAYQRVLALFGEYPLPNAEEAYLGLARIAYQWNHLEAAEQNAQRGLQLARLYDRVIDRSILCEVILAQVKLARGDVDGAAIMLAQTEQTARQKNFVQRLPEIAAAQALVLLRQGDTAAAEQLARQFDLPLGQARALLARQDPAAALAIIEPYRQQMEAKAWWDESLRALVLQAVALRLAGEKDQALSVLAEALALAEPGGFVRLFVDEGEEMRSLLADFRFSTEKPSPRVLAYANKLLAAFTPPTDVQSSTCIQKSEILSPRELEILHLIAEGLTNEQIARQLFLSLYTVKAHVRNIFAKLDATNRTQAVARARELSLLQRR